ncbi:MAG TPA: PA14 domain-containing protein [Niabella sp.]|nr:PA14 domain-containing protein [Niabella sp.]
MGGGELSFSLSSSPNKQRGTQEDALPYSLTIGQKVSIPYNHGDLNLFVGEAEVTLGTATSGAAIYYSLDGKDPDTTSILYQAPFKIQNSYLIKAKAFKKGCQPSPIFSIQASKANMEKGETNPKTENGTNFKYYEGNFSSVSQIEKSVVKASGTIAAPTIKEAMQPDHFGYIFTGFIYIPQDDVYEFMTKSDDRSVLYINNTKVVDNDGSHAAITATGRIALKKGFHPYKLMYFEDYEGDELSWAWKRVADKQYAPIPKENLFVR